jgi:lysyl-tRNA synthetase class 2
MLEFYQAYANYHDLMDLTEELIAFVAREVNGTTLTTFGDVEIDLGKWERLTMREAIVKWWPEDLFGPRPTLNDLRSAESIAGLLDKSMAAFMRKNPGNTTTEIFGTNPAALKAEGSAGKTIAAIFEAVAEEHLIQPTIIYEFPTAISPLSKQKADEPDWTERWEIFAGQMEISNGFSELNDPEEQRRRFQEQLKERERGDEEAHQMDEDYIRALAYGMPPAGGVGVGVDRLAMLLTDSRTIRDVILFPLLRPEKNSTTEESGEHRG